jgi:cellulose synthase/poly-beta-1,6-N-acetylglucosamine synthase-like glycosyltransferase
MIEAVFWLSFAFVFYVYIGYPLLLMVWHRLVQRRVAKGCFEPTVTLVLAAYNEHATIEDKLVNCLSQQYPREKLQIVVSLDGPTDGTDRIAQRFAERGVEIIHSTGHRGKAAALNAAVEKARGEILVFVDARQRLENDAVRNLVTNFQDASVGAASGELILQDDPAAEKVLSACGTLLALRKMASIHGERHSLSGGRIRRFVCDPAGPL